MSNELIATETTPTDFTKELNPKYIDTIIISGWLIGKSDNTKKTYSKILKSYFEFHPRVSISTSTASHITIFLKHLENNKTKTSTINLYMNVLSSLFKFAARQRRIPVDISQGLKNYKLIDNTYQKVIPIESIQQMLLKTSRKRDQILIKIFYYLGLRISEVSLIQIRDFLIKKDMVVLNIKGKGSKLRQSPIDSELWEEIKGYIEDFNLKSSDYLITDEVNLSRKISTTSLWRAIRRASIRAKISPIPSPHHFRHTCFTEAIQNGAPIHLVRERAGHSSLSSTQIYLHAKPGEGLSQYLPKLKKNNE